jgi:hypothetical protein
VDLEISLAPISDVVDDHPKQGAVAELPARRRECGHHVGDPPFFGAPSATLRVRVQLCARGHGDRNPQLSIANGLPVLGGTLLGVRHGLLSTLAGQHALKFSRALDRCDVRADFGIVSGGLTRQGLLCFVFTARRLLDEGLAQHATAIGALLRALFVCDHAELLADLGHGGTGRLGLDRGLGGAGSDLRLRLRRAGRSRGCRLRGNYRRRFRRGRGA